MLSISVQNAQRKEKTQNMDIVHLKFIKFKFMRHMIEQECVDCVISNCAIYRFPHKLDALKEIHRVLKPNGGRICLSDLVLEKPLPYTLRNSISDTMLMKAEYESLLRR